MVTRMEIAVTGASGLVGSALTPALAAAGHRVRRVVRRHPALNRAPVRPSGQPATHPDEVGWNASTGYFETAGLEGAEAVVHLAGENIATGRWTAAKKAAIRASRVEGTRQLCEALAGLPRPPRTLICASAVGYYGDRAQERLTEASAPGQGFLAEVGQVWEAAAEPARRRGIRVVHLRCGMILTLRDGALAKMLLPFRLGVGGVIGNGTQYWSWIALDDVVGVVQHALREMTLRGPVNTVAPQVLTNREFTKTLGRVLGRPTVCPVPGWAARLAFGEMADALLLASTRVEPVQLLATSYPYRWPELEGALRHLLARESSHA